MNTHASKLAITRRELITSSLATVAALALPRTAFAWEEGSCFEDLSVGEYLNMFSPSVYAGLGSDLKELLDSSPMYSNAVDARAALQQSVWISAWNSSAGAVSFTFAFTCSDSCPSLYALVTVTNLSTGASQQREYWGAGMSLSKAGTFYGFAPGSYRAVVTAFSPEPAFGTSSYYSQAWDNVEVI